MSATKKSIRIDTKAALIQAAERLLGENGFAKVTARDIIQEAKARNESALQYHFGDMESLIIAVFKKRAEEADASRLKSLARVDEAGKGQSVPDLINAAIATLFEACEHKSGRLYASFLVQLTADPRFEMEELVASHVPESMRLIRQRLLDCLDYLPREIRERRVRQLSSIAIHVLADYARLKNENCAPPLNEAIDEATACLTGFLLGK